MIVEYIRYELKAHSPDALIAAYSKAAEQLDAALECIDYELAQCVEDANVMILRIRWQSAEAHMKSFRSGPQFPAFLGHIRDFVPEITEMRHYTVTSVACVAETAE
jgi:quinol monooxygenase YgiN